LKPVAEALKILEGSYSLFNHALSFDILICRGPISDFVSVTTSCRSPD
jgi:hypothetical protein